jgi:hypothetical protein
MAGLVPAGLPDPGVEPDDPMLVPAHSWVILTGADAARS